MSLENEATTQGDLFARRLSLPEGFRYQAALLSEGQERDLLQRFTTLPFKEFEFHGFQAKRRVVFFGWRYDFNGGGLHQTDDMPEFLLPVRKQAAEFAALSPSSLQQVLLTEYGPGAAIGWHKDRSVFGEVVGISLLSPCLFRLRRREGTTWKRASLVAEPRSVYLLSGPARSHWEHSIPPVETLRYSITFRNIRAQAGTAPNDDADSGGGGSLK